MTGNAQTRRRRSAPFLKFCSARADARLHIPERNRLVDLGFLRQAEYTFTDDVALDLVGPATDRREVGVQTEEVGVAHARGNSN